MKRTIKRDTPVARKAEGKPAKKKRISVSAAKSKGRQLQQWVAMQISNLLGMPWGPDECIASREGCQNGTDIRLVGPALKEFPFSVECKSQESWSLHSWIDQAKQNCIPGTRWLLVCKRGMKKGQPLRRVIVMDAEEFFDMLRELKK